jgi:hypothetical protein
VRVFDWSGSTWTQIGGDLDGTAAVDEFGYSVALSSDGTRLAVGAHLNDGTGTDAGHVRVFDYDGVLKTKQIIKEDIVEIPGDLRAGRVGIGTNLPLAALDVRGDIIGRGIKFNNKVVVFTTSSVNSSTTMSEAARVYYTPMYCGGSQFQVVCEVTYDWRTVGTGNDWFTVQLLDENDVALDIVYPRYLSGRMIYLPKDLIGVITTSSSSPLTFKLVHRQWVADDANTVGQPRFKIYQILI